MNELSRENDPPRSSAPPKFKDIAPVTRTENSNCTGGYCRCSGGYIEVNGQLKRDPWHHEGGE